MRSLHRGFKGSPPEVGNCGLGHKKEFALSGLSNWFLGGQFGVLFELQAKLNCCERNDSHHRHPYLAKWQVSRLSRPHVESLPTVLKYEKWEPLGPQ